VCRIERGKEGQETSLIVAKEGEETSLTTTNQETNGPEDFGSVMLHLEGADARSSAHVESDAVERSTSIGRILIAAGSNRFVRKVRLRNLT
jgi:hypothetical protein